MPASTDFVFGIALLAFAGWLSWVSFSIIKISGMQKDVEKLIISMNSVTKRLDNFIKSEITELKSIADNIQDAIKAFSGNDVNRRR